MFSDKNVDETSQRRDKHDLISCSVNKYGIIRWLLALPLTVIYSISFALLIPEHKTLFHNRYEELYKSQAVEKSEITTPLTLSADLFHYSSMWQDMIGENPLAHALITSSLEYLFQSMSFLRDIQDSDDDMIKTMIREKMDSLDPAKIEELNADNIYGSINKKGEYFTRLFGQLFSRHGLRKLGSKYSATDLEIFFNLLCISPEEKQFRILLGALVLNVPYYLVIKNSINEYYQNSSVLIPVDLFSFTLFMMFLDEVKNREKRPTIEECRNWVFSVIVPDDKIRSELQAKPFTVQQIIREEMIMPNPGYFSKGYNEKKHKAIDIASERGTMIRSPITGTVQYYEKSAKKSIVGNFIIIKDEKSEYNIFICHMDNKDFIEEHSTEGQLAEPIANLQPDWVHPLKKGQFFEVVGNTGKSTGAHTHIQVAQRSMPYKTYDFLSVNKPYQKQFNSYLKKNGLWSVYSRNEELLLSISGMVTSKYDSTRHFADRDPAVLEQYRQLQRSYSPASLMIDTIDIVLEKIPDNILRTYFSRTIQEKNIKDRYQDQLNYIAGLIFQLTNHLNQKVSSAPALPSRAIPLTPWQIAHRRRYRADGTFLPEGTTDSMFYAAINKYFLYKILQMNYTPRDVRDHLLSDPSYTGNSSDDIFNDLPEYNVRNTGDRINAIKIYIQGIIGEPADLSLINDDMFCESLFKSIIEACKNQGVPLDLNFGFFRYDIEKLQELYQSSKFMKFSDVREFAYEKKYNQAIMSFFLDIFELAAEHHYCSLFRELFIIPDEPVPPSINKIFQNIRKRIKKTCTGIKRRILHRAFPVEPAVAPYNFFPAFQKLIENIIKPVSYESRTYANKVYYRSTELNLFYSLIYEVYFTERELYMELFPEEELTGVIEAIGLFDSMFRVFCDNAVRKQLIDNEHSRITHELETAERELNGYKKSKKQLQDDFRKETISLKQLNDYVSSHTELFAKYFKEEEKINEKITGLEQSLDRYRNECIALKKEKNQMQTDHDERLKKIAAEIETLKAKSSLDQDRFTIRLRNISYHKEKAEKEIVELKNELDTIKKEIELKNIQLNESDALLKKYKKAVMIRNTRNSEQETLITELSNEISSIRAAHEDLINIIGAALGINTTDITADDLSSRVFELSQQSSMYTDQNSSIRLLQEQQKNDKRSLMLNASLITELKDQTAKLQLQLDYLQNTTSSAREKDLENENRELSAAAGQLKEEIRSLRKIISKSR